jgi:hypothetical protein
MTMTNGRMAIAAIAAASLATFAVGLTAVAAATTAKPVKACVNTKHDLSLLKKGKCAAGSHKVSIAVKGPRGAKGKNGLSTGYGASTPGTTGNYLLTTGYSTITSLSLPAGRYIVTWNVTMSNDSATAGAFQCEVTYPGGNGGAEANDINGNGSFVGRASLAQSVPVATSAAGTLALACESTSGTEIRAGNGEPQNVNAIAVNTLPSG